MKVLGVYDWHNCGASLVEDGKIVAALEEERLSRNKIEFGFPYRSIEAVLDITGTQWEDLDAVAVAGVRDPIPFARWRPHTFKFERKMGRYWNFQYTLWRGIYGVRNLGPFPSVERLLNRSIVVRKVRELAHIPKDRIFLVDHHLCHAASAYRTSGFDEALVFAIDGSGDGYSTTVFEARNGDIRFLAGAPERASLGKLYSNVTLGLGFKKISGEGKVMGLAAHGDPNVFYPVMDRVLQLRNVDTLDMVATEDLLGNTFAKRIRAEYAQEFSREDISAAVQRKLESVAEAIVKHFVEKTGIRNLVFAGGVISNVKMNQVMRELDGVENIFVFPNMTDGGLSSGAALEICYQEMLKQGERLPPYRVEEVFFGPGFTDEDARLAVERHGLPAEYVEDMDTRIADLVIEGNIVARVTGRMEFGPRALGNRSTLVLPSLPGIEDKLNERFRRDEFMPFAPSLPEERIGEYLVGGQKSPFMIETFDVKPGLEKRFPAVVHVDRTLRPQTVNREVMPGYWHILDRIGEATGNYIVLNTSYNMHGEPIVCSPDDAVNTFLNGCVDYLALGNYLLNYELVQG
jgi:carbamoyltransferase